MRRINFYLNFASGFGVVCYLVIFSFFFTIYFLNKKKDIDVEKEMLALVRFKSGEGKFEKFMRWMQSDEGIAERKKN